VTPLRDGMNLVAKEYAACRADHGPRVKAGGSRQDARSPGGPAGPIQIRISSR